MSNEGLAEVKRIQEGKTVTVQIDGAEQYIYSNATAIAISPMDIRIDFADVTARGRKSTIVGVILSPEAAKFMHTILGEQLERFEQAFGQIRSSHIELHKPPRPDIGDGSAKGTV